MPAPLSHVRDQNEYSSPWTPLHEKTAEEGINTKLILIRETLVISVPRLKDRSIKESQSEGKGLIWWKRVSK